MTYRGRVYRGQILLEEPARLPEGAAVRIQVAPADAPITRPRNRVKPPAITPVELPGPSLADDLVMERR